MKGWLSPNCLRTVSCSLSQPCAAWNWYRCRRRYNSCCHDGGVRVARVGKEVAGEGQSGGRAGRRVGWAAGGWEGRGVGTGGRNRRQQGGREAGGRGEGRGRRGGRSAQRPMKRTHPRGRAPARYTCAFRQTPFSPRLAGPASPARPGSCTSACKPTCRLHAS